jgi:hypothetical protein
MTIHALETTLRRTQDQKNRRTSFVFRMDFLLAGTLFSLFMEFQCRVIVQRACASERNGHD